MNKIIANKFKYGVLIVSVGIILLGASCGTPQDGGLFRSLDYADTWESRNFVSQEGRRAQTIGNVNVTRMAFHPEDSNIAFLGTKGNGIYITVDAGEHWAQGQISTGNIYAIAIDPINPEIMYIAKDISILKSEDSGKTWEIVYTDVKGAKINTLVVDSYDHSRIYAGTSAGAVFKSIDFGINWDLRMQMEEPVKELLIPTYNTRIIYALLDDGQIFKTISSAEPTDPEKADEVNSGWYELLPSEVRDQFDGPMDVFDMALDPTEESILYIVTKRGLMRGQNEATEWSDVPTLLGFNESENEYVRNISIDQDDSDIIYFTIDRIIHRSLDYGKTWTTIETFPSTREITSFNIDSEVSNVIYAGTELKEEKGGLIKRSDNK